MSVCPLHRNMHGMVKLIRMLSGRQVESCGAAASSTEDTEGINLASCRSGVNNMANTEVGTTCHNTATLRPPL